MSLCQPVIWSMAAILLDSIVVVAATVVRTRPRAIPLAMKSIHGFLYGLLMGLRLAALRAAGAPLKILKHNYAVNKASLQHFNAIHVLMQYVYSEP